MNKGLKRILIWSPRILCIVFVVFISMFALDVFGQGSSLKDTIFGLLIHLAPTILVIIILLFTWRRAWVGAILFIAGALLFLLISRGEAGLFLLPCFWSAGFSCSTGYSGRSCKKVKYFKTGFCLHQFDPLRKADSLRLESGDREMIRHL